MVYTDADNLQLADISAIAEILLWFTTANTSGVVGASSVTKGTVPLVSSFVAKNCEKCTISTFFMDFKRNIQKFLIIFAAINSPCVCTFIIA